MQLSPETSFPGVEVNNQASVGYGERNGDLVTWQYTQQYCLHQSLTLCIRS